MPYRLNVPTSENCIFILVYNSSHRSYIEYLSISISLPWWVCCWHSVKWIFIDVTSRLVFFFLNNDNKIVYVLTKKCSELQVWHEFRPKQMETAKYWLSFECVCWNKAVKYQRHIDNTWIISRVYSRNIDYLEYSFVFLFYIYETVRLFSDPFRCCFSLPRYLCILAMEQFVCMGEKRSVYVCVYVIAYACAYVCMSYVRLLWEMELQQTMW